jgi:hypothetical protein
VMNDLGLHITYKDGSAPAAAPSVSPAPSLASSASALGGNTHVFAGSLRRPASSFSMSSSTMRGSSPMKPEVASSPVKPDFKIPLRPDTAFSDQGQGNRIPFTTPHLTNPFSTSPADSTFVPSSTRSRIESFHQFPIQNHSLYISQMEREVSTHSTPSSEKS